jgi:hypothetical protein
MSIAPTSRGEGQGQPTLPLCYAWLAETALERNIFFEPQIIEPALRHLAPDGVEVCVAVDLKSALPRAAMPVHRPQGRYGLLPVPLTVWHHPYSMVGTPLVSPDDPAQALDALLTQAAHRQDGPPVLLMPKLLADGPVWPLLQRVVDDSGRRMQVLQSTSRAGLRLNAEAAADASLRTIIGSKSNRSINASRRKLADHGALSHTTATSRGDVPEALAIFLALEAKGWKGRNGTALATLGHDGFVLAMAANLAKEERVRVDLTWLQRPGHEPQAIAGTIAIAAGTNDAPIWMPWKIAYDETLTEAGPGALGLANLTDRLLQHAQEAGQPLLIDSLATPGSVVANRLWRDPWTLVDVLIDLKPGGSAAFGAILAAEKVRRSAYDTAKNARAAIKRAAKRAQKAIGRHESVFSKMPAPDLIRGEYRFFVRKRDTTKT